MRHTFIFVGLAGALCCVVNTSSANEWSGFAALEYRGFAHAPLYAEQHQSNYSALLQPEYRYRPENSKDTFTFIPFARLDQHDAERSHADIRELAWVNVHDDYEWRLGIRKVFWGVAESQHLVDIINQTDLVENFDAKSKLGQPMVNLALINTWGTLDLFALPYFRERTFLGTASRLRSEPIVASDLAVYQAEQGRHHLDYAAHWSKSFGDFDLGLSHFVGNSREPRLLPGINGSGAPVLIPYYDLIHQTGVEFTAPTGSWLWKLEAIHRTGQATAYTASTAGVEYTYSALFGSSADLGVLFEYLYDDRGAAALSPFQDDVMLGVRLALNDTQSSDLLFTLIQDRHSTAHMFNLEANRRLGSNWKLTLQARAFAGIPSVDPLYSMRQDSYMELLLARYF
jgi:hypothetical protein